MSEQDLHFGQRVIWTNRAGTAIPARIVDIIPGKNEAQIRVLHERGAQLLWVRLAALAPAASD